MWPPRLLTRRFLRYSLVGLAGVPLNLGALAVALHLLGAPRYALASLCAFEASTLLVFVANQEFTFADLPRLTGWLWAARASKAQLASLASSLVAFGLSLLLHDGPVHLSPYLSNTGGIAGAFLLGFSLTHWYVFPALDGGERPPRRL